MSQKRPKSEPAFKAAITQKFVSSRGPISRLKARRMGLDFLTGTAPTLEFYYEAGDPHSALSMQWLRENRQRIGCPIRIRIVGEPEAGNYPERPKQRQFALDDVRRIAPALGLGLKNTGPLGTDAHVVNEEQRIHGNRFLIPHESNLDAFLEKEQELGQRIFSEKDDAFQAFVEQSAACSIEDAQRHLNQHSRRRDSLGHYLPAMWQFNGEWFWALDRMHHLEQRLRAHGLLDGDKALVTCDASKANLPAFEALPELEFFFSFRSPYSYLAAVEIKQLAATWPMPVRVRPVLPMAMRGMKISLGKMLYIPRDTYREAEYLGQPFGRASDPVGEPVERCITAFSTIDDEQTRIDFVAEAATAIWCEAVKMGEDEGLQPICERAGLDWNKVHAALGKGMQLDLAEENRQALFDAGLWGVPSFKLGNFATWGRDRIWMIEEIVRRSNL